MGDWSQGWLEESRFKPRRDRAMLRQQLELNKHNYASERWFTRLLEANGIGGCERNRPLINRFWGDFVWQSHMLVVEIDGGVHEKTVERDDMRDTLLRYRGYTVVRIPKDDLSAVMDFIVKWKAKLPSSAELPIVCPQAGNAPVTRKWLKQHCIDNKKRSKRERKRLAKLRRHQANARAKRVKPLCVVPYIPIPCELEREKLIADFLAKKKAC